MWLDSQMTVSANRETVPGLLQLPFKHARWIVARVRYPPTESSLACAFYHGAVESRRADFQLANNARFFSPAMANASAAQQFVK